MNTRILPIAAGAVIAALSVGAGIASAQDDGTDDGSTTTVVTDGTVTVDGTDDGSTTTDVTDGTVTDDGSEIPHDPAHRSGPADGTPREGCAKGAGDGGRGGPGRRGPGRA